MFVIHLTRSQQLALLSLARELVVADSVATYGEVKALTRLRREAGITSDTPVEALAVSRAAERFDTRQSQLVALVELLVVGHADHRLSSGEKGLIRRLALTWNIDNTRLNDIEDWVRGYRRLMAEGEELISGS